jgi:hypothetical protein
LGWGAAGGRPILVWYSASCSPWTASSRRRSKAVTGRPRQRSGGADHGAVGLRCGSSRSPTGTLVKALARAWRWQRLLDDGAYASVSDIGDAENISTSYVSRILRLALLAPDIIDAILAGKTDQALMLERLERPLPASWEEQRGFARERA